LVEGERGESGEERTTAGMGEEDQAVAGQVEEAEPLSGTRKMLIKCILAGV
jgi:hypothetical protein